MTAPTRLTVFLAISVLLPGCSCRVNPPPVDPPSDVSIGSLIRLYRDTPQLAERSYTGRLVRIRLDAGSYRGTPDGIGVTFGSDWFGIDTNPVVVFRCVPPPANSAPVVVVGRVAGVVRDGVRRGPGIDWYILVVDCSVSTQA